MAASGSRASTKAIIDRQTFESVQALLKSECHPPENQALRKRRPAPGQAVRRQGQPHEPELFKQETACATDSTSVRRCCGDRSKLRDQWGVSLPQRSRVQFLQRSDQVKNLQDSRIALTSLKCLSTSLLPAINCG